MLTTAPHLHIRRPSPTTTEFTVSTLPPQTMPLRLLLAVVNLLRLLLGITVLLVLYAKWSLYSPYTAPASPPEALSLASLAHALQHVLDSAPGRLAQRAAAGTPAWALGPAALVALYAAVRRVHAAESLLVLRGLGIQTSSSGATVLGAAATRFIPTEKIQDVLINEAFRGFEVRHYLIVVVDGEEDVVVVFPKLLPRRDVVERVWRGVRGCLFDVKPRPKDDDGQARGNGRRTNGKI
ncbi:uncharacterized protein JN550_007194 [Neoarthrinium moseri]|uniref:uncharacterized protein n=1 Tax=Neoarthrinium moseri TaxID=1658444 RepID=UPI001FDDC3D4|nr:uncharacterized protein JN550_007194 [Neoarthrinium moseri]KAI1867142.1 hypothetical protein JN550_007194 [Neoarthrinium moseri]